MREKKNKLEEYTPFGKRLAEAFNTDNAAVIARKTGVSHSKVHKDLTEKLPGPEILQKYSRASGCSIHWLLEGVGPKTVIELKQAAKESVELDLEKIREEAVEAYETNLMLAIKRGDFVARKERRAKTA